MWRHLWLPYHWRKAPINRPIKNLYFVLQWGWMFSPCAPGVKLTIFFPIPKRPSGVNTWSWLRSPPWQKSTWRIRQWESAAQKDCQKTALNYGLGLMRMGPKLDPEFWKLGPDFSKRLACDLIHNICWYLMSLASYSYSSCVLFIFILCHSFSFILFYCFFLYFLFSMVTLMNACF